MCCSCGARGIAPEDRDEYIEYQEYVATDGETLADVARRYEHATVEGLIELNDELRERGLCNGSTMLLDGTRVRLPCEVPWQNSGNSLLGSQELNAG